MSLQTEFGQRVKQQRIKAGITQLELGVAVGLSERQIRNIEKGVHPTDLSRVEQLSAALHTPVRELFPE